MRKALFFLLTFLKLVLPNSAALTLSVRHGGSNGTSTLLKFLVFIFKKLLSPLAKVNGVLCSANVVVITYYIKA